MGVEPSHVISPVGEKIQVFWLTQVPVINGRKVQKSDLKTTFVERSITACCRGFIFAGLDIKL